MSPSPALPPLPAAALRLGTLFAAAGYELYLVGGAVRDQVLGLSEEGEDIDLTTNARPGEVLELLEPVATAIWRQGEKFGTIGATVEGRAVEVTTYRREIYSSESRKPDVGFGDDLETDLSRRDFTINAMARDVLTGEMVDPFGGHHDLVARRLRTPLSPEISFQDDPLRMLRAARFGARLGMSFDPLVRVAANDLAERMSIVSGERIFAELDRLLSLPNPGDGLRFLWDTGVMGSALGVATLPAFDRVRVSAMAQQSPPDTGIRWAALVDFTGHTVEAAAAHLKMSSEHRRDLQALLTLQIPDSTAAAPLRAMLADHGKNLVIRAVALNRILARVEHDRLDRFVSAFEQLTAAVSREDLEPPMSGDDVQEVLGIRPGPAVGAALNYLRDEAVKNGPLSRSEAEALLIARRDPGGAEG
ncbi:MAG: CCA tRNA nucleotidyltransferase [Acidimicrobiales bacterium]|nr:CCA tRNA nucleotidyltransferase [Acidimicrobiales bacterium]